MTTYRKTKNKIFQRNEQHTELMFSFNVIMINYMRLLLLVLLLAVMAFVVVQIKMRLLQHHK